MSGGPLQRAMPASKHQKMLQSVCMFTWCVSENTCISPLTRLFKSSFHPLGQPAQVTVTVQGVGSQSTRDRRTIAVRTRICSVVHSYEGKTWTCTHRWDKEVRWLKAPSGIVERSLPCSVLKDKTCDGRYNIARSSLFQSTRSIKRLNSKNPGGGVRGWGGGGWARNKRHETTL